MCGQCTYVRTGPGPGRAGPPVGCGHGMVDRRKGPGFTLIELLVTVAIIAMLVTILLPSLKQAKQNAKSVVCQTRIKGWYGAQVLYGQDWNGLVAACTAGTGSGAFRYKDGEKLDIEWMHCLTEWPEKLLKACDEANGTHYVGTDGPWRPPVVYAEGPELFFCPSRREGEWLGRHYKVNDAQAGAYGTYGLNMAGFAWTWQSLWEIIIPDRMYMATDCYTTYFDRWDEDDDQYDARHGPRYDTVNMLFTDGHIEATYEKDIVLRFEVPWRGGLPWYNSHLIYFRRR